MDHVRRLLRSAPLWIAILSIIAYWDDTALHGKFVYDDAGSVRNNVVVKGAVPWKEVFLRDYWGTNMTTPQSHKSFRPVTTLTFKANWMLSEYLEGRVTATNTKPVPDQQKETFWFHVVNICLHGCVTYLVTRAAYCAFRGGLSTVKGMGEMMVPSEGDRADNLQATFTATIAGTLFGLHPVHTEAVSNITSRGEMLMSIGFLVGFLSFVQARQKSEHSEKMLSLLHRVGSLSGIYLVPWLAMTFSVFSKEQGATALITIVIHDFLKQFDSVFTFLSCLFSKSAENSHRRGTAWRFLRRTLILALQTLTICAWRYHLNGETSPDFIFDQNPAAFSKDRFTRFASVTWVYCLYFRDYMDPRFLCPDWSGDPST